MHTKALNKSPNAVKKLERNKVCPKGYVSIYSKDWGTKKGHNLLSYFVFSKKVRKYLILLPAFYLIMWLMKLPKNFEKIAILKIGELFSFLGVKIQFGKK